MRPLSACIACRDRRKKCDRPRQGTSCTFCIKRGLACTVEQKPAPAPGDDYEPLVSPRGDGALPIASASIMPDRELCNELVELYFRYCHFAFHNLFHRPSFEASVRDGSVPRVLIFCVISLTARLSSHPYFADIDPQERGRPYAKEAERLLDLHKTCLTTIQACILLGSINVIEMDGPTESIFYTIACRMAMILDLPNFPAKTRIEQEVSLRVWWSVVATDTWSSTALGLPRAIQPRYDIPMPMDELVFLHLRSDEPPVFDDPVSSPNSAGPTTSLVGQMIKLNRILFEVNTLNTKIVSEYVGEAEIQHSVAELAMALDRWLDELPAELQDTQENLLYWMGQGCGTPFIVLHINYNHVGELLFYQFLLPSLESGDPSLSDVTSAYATRCKKHAADLCELIYRARQQTEVLYPLVGHIIVIASTVQLYTLLFSPDDDEIAVARSRLENNFQIISLLQNVWPGLRASFSRLEVFHKACLESKDNSFRLDRWMLRFLLTFAQPIAEREQDVGKPGQVPWSLAHLARP